MIHKEFAVVYSFDTGSRLRPSLLIAKKAWVKDREEIGASIAYFKWNGKTVLLTPETTVTEVLSR